MLAVMWPTTFASAQELAAATAKTPVAPYTAESAGFLQRYREISALPLRDRATLYRNSSPQQKSNVRRAALALQLVERPGLTDREAQIFIDAISLYSPEFFTMAEGTSAERAKANNALQSLAHRARATLPHNEATELFANVGGEQAEDELLRKYDDISALPLPKRKAYFRNSTPKDQADLWRTHLALFLAKRPDFNDWQRETVMAAMSLSTPNWFAVTKSDPDWKAKVGDVLRALENRILAAFSLEEGAQIFATLGDPTQTADRTPVNKRPALLASINYKWTTEPRPYQQWTMTRLSAQEQYFDTERSACQCSNESDWCPIYGQCTGSNCNPTPNGCGTLWKYSCNGASCQ
jgi:hypothetical protein